MKWAGSKTPNEQGLLRIDRLEGCSWRVVTAFVRAEIGGCSSVHIVGILLHVSLRKWGRDQLLMSCFAGVSGMLWTRIVP